MKKLAVWDLLLSVMVWAIVFLAYIMGYGYFTRLQILGGGLFIIGVVISIGLIGAVTVYALRKYRGQMIGPRLYILAVILGLIPVAIFAGLAFANTALDDSPPAVTRVKVVQLGEAQSQGRHQLAVEFWRSRPTVYNILVDQETFKQCYVGRPLWVTTRKGALGFEWLVGVTLRPDMPDDNPTSTVQTEF